MAFNVLGGLWWPQYHLMASMVSDGLNWPQIASNNIKWPQIASNGLKWPRWPLMASNSLKWHRWLLRALFTSDDLSGLKWPSSFNFEFWDKRRVFGTMCFFGEEAICSRSTNSFSHSNRIRMCLTACLPSQVSIKDLSYWKRRSLLSNAWVQFYAH